MLFLDIEDIPRGYSLVEVIHMLEEHPDAVLELNSVEDLEEKLKEYYGR